MQLDETDRRILRALQRNSKRTSTEIAAEIGLSQTPYLRRVRRLEEGGAIDRYVAILNPAALGLGMTIFTRIWLTGQDGRSVDAFAAAVRKMPEVVECHLMAGDCDFLLRVVVADIASYRHFQAHHLTRLPGVQSVKTEIPMQQIKASTEIPV
ncbi:Lrp/AsnC family transcriptional regulator [Mangrovicoccus algicola]|uniref:Lrp/AsnC family transcriptional regulator n=1 Tax=Mangrovicoccus algicola TaxID=2771008 RepID=A0A8J7CJ65_9RHOB|nr:Lrp/AsnC family transcriptional regulator [Mangrovicoccus algicola]MBE3640440.1 Lrp/AsnC family transcriptional regulator [Mangrovicoccus algicola]